MAKKSPNKPLKDKVIDAALNLAAEEGWNAVTFEQIILAAGVDELEVREYFDDKTDIIVAYGRHVDRQVLENTSFSETSEMSTREKLFDLLMERFDVLNENRDAIISILESFKGDPKQAIVSLPHLAKSMARSMEVAGVETEGASGAIKVTGMIGVYLYVVRTWKDDDSADMAKTMAALDKALDKAEMTANSCEDGTILSSISAMAARFSPKNNDKAQD